MLLTYRVICVSTTGQRWYAYSSSLHATLDEALAVMAERQGEAWESITLTPLARAATRRRGETG